MLTRLKVSGFKNLEDVDVRFGPFTCIAGANGVGKSNVFDAIGFLSGLAKYTLIEAARRVRADDNSGDVGSLFARVGDEIGSHMQLDAEMIIPSTGTDDSSARRRRLASPSSATRSSSSTSRRRGRRPSPSCAW